MIASVVIIVLSLVILIFTAAGRGSPGPDGLAMAYVHMATCVLIVLSFVALALREVRGVSETGEVGAARISGIIGQYSGFVFAWGTAALLATYGTGIVTWKEWPGFMIVFAVLAVVSLYTSRRHFAAAETGRVDPGFWKISRYLGIALTVGMIIVMVGLLVDGKMTRFLEIQRTNWQDWAANNYFFFGAMALAILGAYGLRTTAGMIPSDQDKA